MNQKEFGKFIAKLRKEKKLTQEQLGEKLGVNSRTISRWENGNYMPDISLFEGIGKELDVSVLELLKCKKIEKDNYIEESNKKTVEMLKSGRKNKRKSLIVLILSIMLLSCLGLFSLYQYFEIKELKKEDDTIPFINGIYTNEVGVEMTEVESRILSFFDINVRVVSKSDKENYINYYYNEWENIAWYGNYRFYEKVRDEDDYIVVKSVKEASPFIHINFYEVEEKEYCALGYSKYGTYIVSDYKDNRCIVDDVICERLKNDGATVIVEIGKYCS